jgi:type IV secretion system protein TrbG
VKRPLLLACLGLGLLGCATNPPPRPVVELPPLPEPVVETPVEPPTLPEPPPIEVMEPEEPPVKNPVKTMAQALREARIEPPWRRLEGALVTFTMKPYAVYHIYTAPDHQTDLEWPAGETLLKFSKADSEGWDMDSAVSGTGTRRQFHLLIKPKLHGLKTNVVALTDRHTYHIALSSTKDLYLPVVTWHDPSWVEPQPVAAKPQPRIPPQRSTAYEVKNLGKNTPTWMPTGAWDDGQRMVIAFSPALLTGEAPNVWIVNADGSKQLVNHHTLADTYYVIDRLVDALELRVGNAKSYDVVQVRRTGS